MRGSACSSLSVMWMKKILIIEHLICCVACKYFGQVPKWPKGADCKSVAIGFQGSNPCLPTTSGLFSLGVESLLEYASTYCALQCVKRKRAGVAQW